MLIEKVEHTSYCEGCKADTDSNKRIIFDDNRYDYYHNSVRLCNNCLNDLVARIIGRIWEGER